MRYKRRNTIVLGSFLIILATVCGYFVLWAYPAKLEAAQTELDKVNREIKKLEGLEAQFYDLESLIKEKEEKIAAINKRVTPDITTADVYGYLNTILNYSGIIEFNLATGESKDFKGFGYRNYFLRGEATFNRIYNFIWYIEQGPHVYEITRVNLKGLESKDPETEKIELVIPFDMEIRAYYANVENLPNPPKTLRDVRVSKAGNPFYPYILRNLPPNVDNLVDVERAELKAVIPGKALIADSNGKIHVLKEGDPVYLGFLTKINTETAEAEFTLNKGGIIEHLVLKLRFDESKDGK